VFVEIFRQFGHGSSKKGSAALV